MKTALHRLLLLLSFVFLASPASAALEEIIGTWKRADGSIVEFRPDGTIFTKDAQVGTWQKLRESRQYVVRMNGAVGYYFQTTLGSYQRKLTMRHSGNGNGVTIDRIDNGPVQNPDVPDERAAQELEFTDLENRIESLSARVGQLYAEAAEARQKHEIARALGKISGWIPVAQKKEQEAKAAEAGLNAAKSRLAALEKVLGKTSRISQASPASQPGVPQVPVGMPGAGGFPPGMVPPGVFPPGYYPPGFVPGRPFNRNTRQ
ncbi:MAG: hypothetical protein IPK22_15180 [Verrucomicrobiaceae bacterium]|nr:hypothetical protein [Verrucomicrobiaceae bacterium]